MRIRLLLMIAAAILAGLAVLRARPAARRRPSSEPWRGRIKPPPPPP